MADSPESLCETKKQLRAKVLARRDAIAPIERAAKSAWICEYLWKKLAAGPNADFGGNQLKRGRHKGTEAGTVSLNVDFGGGQMERGLSDGIARASVAFNADFDGNWMADKKIAVYQAMRSEVDLEQFDRAAYAAGARVCFPCMMRLHAGHSLRNVAYEGQRSFMVFREVPQARFESGDVPFAVNPLKFYEFDDPLLADFPVVEPEDLDAVIVPLVAFDEHFNRMGYGGGNYDHLLPRLRKDAVVIGVAFAEQQVESLPLEPHDQALPGIVFA